MKKLRKSLAILTTAALIISTALLASACGGSKPSQTDWPTRAPEAADNNEPVETEPAEVEIPDSVKIDETTFPDANFRKYVFENFDANGDWELSKEEISIANKIILAPYNEVDSIKGVEYLTNLETLSCDNIELSDLDLTKNTKLTYLELLFAKPEKLDLSKNAELIYLKVLCNLTELDVSNNAKLETLDCSRNMLTKLNLSNNTNLITADCSDNNLTELVLSNTIKLENLNCSKNELTELDVSNCTEMKELNCFENNISSIDISNLANLERLSLGSNNISKLNASNLTKLKSLICNDNNITEIDLSNCPKMEYVHCLGTQITSLDVSDCSENITIYCEDTTAVQKRDGQYIY